MKLSKYIFVFLIFGGLLHAQDTARIMAYNLLNYVSTDTTRNQYYRTVVNAANPDILVAEEMTSQTVVDIFRNKVLNLAGIGTFSSGVFIDGPDTDNEIFFRQDKFAFISNTPIITALRYISMFKMVHLATLDTFYIFAVHLKASSGSTNENDRAAEVDSLRKVTNSFPAGTNFMVMGDFNIYRDGEPCYTKLKAPGGFQGQFIDAITMTGTWNNGSYAQYHTQSPRVRSFGGGATGGMDDRFDLILYSQAVSEPGGVTYIPGSMIPFGNDGLHYNDSINRPPNNAVGQIVANALHYASDHIPIMASFRFEPPTGILPVSSVASAFSLEQNYPNPFNPDTKIRFSLPAASQVQLAVYDVLGREIAVLIDASLEQGQYEYTWNAEAYPAGVYFYRLKNNDDFLTRKMILSK